jgi:LuxR family transcriptional regulator, maltose regulon positive regulatory protein
MQSSILTTKLHQPALPAKQVPRPHLIQSLDDGLAEDRLLTLVSAPAGFGKTTCVTEWLQHLDLQVAWLSLDPSDNDPVRFFTYFLAALRRVDPSLVVDLHQVISLGELPPTEIITGHLINAIMDLPDRFLVVLDDFQVINDSTILQFLEQMLANQPYQMHLVLVTREDPLLPLARLRANNRMTEIRAADLRFNAFEATSFLNERMGLSLSADDIQTLENRTEGWIAGLQLAGLSMRNQPDPSQFIANLSGSHRFILNYLMEEVLQNEPSEIQEFMLQTSILDRLNGALCDAVTGRTGSHALLEQLYNANLFLIPLDDEQNWYRYHHLFADLLRSQQSRLPKAMVAELHQRASQWYEAVGLTAEAIEHALTVQDYPRAVLLLEKYAMPILTQGYAKSLEGWMQTIPAELQTQNPKANMAFAWMQLLRGSYDKITTYLKYVEPAISQTQPGEIPEDENTRLLLAEWCTFQSNFLNVMGKPDDSIAFVNRALQLIPPDNHYLLGQAHLGLGGAYRLKGDFTHLVEAYQKAARYSVLSSNILGEMLAVAAVTLASIHYGQLRFALATGTGAVERFQNASNMPPPITGTVYGSIGLVYYEWNQLERAQQNFEKSKQLAELVGHNAGLVYSGVICSRLYQAQEDTAAAERAIQEATRLLPFGAPAWLRPEVALQRVRILLSAGDPASAEAVITQYEAAAPPHILLQLARLRWQRYQAIFSGSESATQAGIALANQLVTAAKQQTRMGIVLQALLLRAQLQPLVAGLADIRQALELAKPEGFIRTFLDEGPAVAQLLKRLPESSEHKEYLYLLLAAFGDTPPTSNVVAPSQALIEPLSERELEVLHLMARGLKYEEIAAELVITLNTVRFHVKHIYGKLNVNNRTQAIETARQYDLI